MKKITVNFAIKMKEIYNCIMERIVDTGNIEESDMLFIMLYKSYFENTNVEEGEE